MAESLIDEIELAAQTISQSSAADDDALAQPLVAAEALPELLEYPHLVADIFFGTDVLRDRIRGKTKLSPFDAAAQIFENGVRLHTRYSGIGMAEIACKRLEQVLCEHAAAQGFRIPGTWAGFSMESAFDLKESARTILLDHHECSRPKHVFGNMTTMLSSKAKFAFEGLADQYGKQADERERQARWNDMVDLLETLRQEGKLFDRRRTAWCFVHGRPCRMWSHEHEDKEFKGIRICIAGLTCKDNSTMNRNRVGFRGKSGATLLLFIFEALFARWDIILSECTPLISMEPFEQMMAEYYTWESFLWGPEQLGWWTTRRRRFTVFWLKPAHGGKVQMAAGAPRIADLLAMFERSRPESGDGMMFAAASDEQVQQAYRSVLSSRVKADIPADRYISAEEMLGETRALRLQLQRLIYLESHGYEYGEIAKLEIADIRALILHHVEEDGYDQVVDLEHQPRSNWAKLSRELPTLLSHGELFSLRKDRCMIADEHLASQGLAILASSVARSASEPPWGSAWSRLSERSKKDLAGNTINCAILMTILALIVRVAERFAATEVPEPAEVAGNGSGGSSACHSLVQAAKRQRASGS